VPSLNSSKEITLNVNGADVPVAAFADAMPILREEMTQYFLQKTMFYMLISDERMLTGEANQERSL